MCLCLGARQAVKGIRMTSPSLPTSILVDTQLFSLRYFHSTIKQYPCASTGIAFLTFYAYANPAEVSRSDMSLHVEDIADFQADQGTQENNKPTYRITISLPAKRKKQ